MSPTDPPPAGPCPSPADIRDLLLGRGPAGAADRLARHLVGCPACAAAVDAAAAGSPVLDALRREPPAGPSADELSDLSARLSRLAPSRPTRPSGGTLTTVADPPAPPPDLLGPYRLRERLGAGGMGVVYRAEDTALRRPVALKLLKPGADRDPRYRERFLREARAMAAVKHDHIVTVFQVGEADGGAGPVPFLAMELLDGQSLHEWMRANPRPPVGWAVRIARQAAAGLAAAHARGLVHRDVKPGNLWLETPPGWAVEPADGRPPLGAAARVKLLDFGLARPADEVGGTDGAAGTPGYMAPEQARGDRLDARADLFGLGCVLYELCTGRHPFPGRGDGRSADPTPPSADAVNPTVPPALAALVGRLLAANPAARPASAREVERELAALEAVGDGPPTLADRRDDTVPDARPRRAAARRRYAAAAGSLAACVAVAAGVAVWGGGPTAVPSIASRTADPAPAAADRPPFPVGPPDDQWCRQLADRPPKEQFGLVARKLQELNPGYDAKRATGWVEPELVLRFVIRSNAVHDLRPLRGLTELKNLWVVGQPPDGGPLTDLSPLAGLRLTKLVLTHQPRLRDLSPLAGGRLTVLDVSHTAVESLDPVRGQPLLELDVSHTKVRDLGFVRSLPQLRLFRCTGCPIANWEPLAGTPIRELWADVNADAAVLSRMPSLERLNGQPVRGK